MGALAWNCYAAYILQIPVARLRGPRKHMDIENMDLDWLSAVFSLEWLHINGQFEVSLLLHNTCGGPKWFNYTLGQ